MTERVRFYWDPICPWCYQTSRWVRRLAELGEVELSWGLFSLEIANAEDEQQDSKPHARSAPALRTAVVLGEQLGNDAVGDFYAVLGRRVHEEGAAVDDHSTLEASLREAGSDSRALEQALDDDRTWDRVRAQHDALVERTRSFGVPTIGLDDGEGPTIFGPVISQVPTDADAVELFRHVTWLARYENFSELKRDRVLSPDLESVRRRRAERGR